MNIPGGATHQSEDGDYLKDTDANIKIFAEGDWEDVSQWIMLGAIKLDKTEIKADKVESITKDIDWDCDEVEGKNYCLVSSVGTQFFCSELPNHDGIVWYSEYNLNTKDTYTLHKRPAQESTYTQEMYNDKYAPDIGMKFMGSIDAYGVNKKVECVCIGLTENSDGDKVITFEHGTNKIDVSFCNDEWVKPIDTRTQAQKDTDKITKHILSVIKFNGNDTDEELAIKLSNEFRFSNIPHSKYTGEL